MMNLTKYEWEGHKGEKEWSKEWKLSCVDWVKDQSFIHLKETVQHPLISLCILCPKTICKLLL